MNRDNEYTPSNERVYEGVFGNDLERSVDNNLRYSNRRNYVKYPTEHEEMLGKTFEASTVEEKRLKRLQDQAKKTRHVLYKKSYEEKSVVLSYYLKKAHLQDVYELASHFKELISDKELLPTLLALYELKLFIETEQLIPERTYKEILHGHYYNKRDVKFSKQKLYIKTFSTIFFHRLGKIVRDLYTQEGRILDFHSKMVNVFSVSIRAFIDTYMYDDMNKDKKYKSMFFTDKYEELKLIRAPRFFIKAMFNQNVKQRTNFDKQESYYQSIQFFPLFNILDTNRVKKSIRLFFELNIDPKETNFIPSALALYEITLFIETGKLIDSNKLQKIFNDLEQQNKGGILHRIYWNYYNILIRQTKLLITHDTFYQRKIDDIINIFYLDWKIYFGMRGPRFFSENPLGYRIVQKSIILSYLLYRRPFTYFSVQNTISLRVR